MKTQSAKSTRKELNTGDNLLQKETNSNEMETETEMAMEAIMQETEMETGTDQFSPAKYCKKEGHGQKVCNSRIKNNASMVDKFGKPFTYNGNRKGKVRKVYQNQGAASVSQSLIDHLKGPCGAISSVDNLQQHFSNSF